MMSGAPRSGSLYWLTSVPQTPAISIFRSAASAGISGRSNSRSSVVDAPTFTAARVFPVAAMAVNLSPSTHFQVASDKPQRDAVSGDRGGAGRREWVLVRARPVDRRYGNANLAQINGELPAMVIPVIQ